METKKAVGRQGWWFAEVDGEALPCIHKHWLKGKNYHDPFERHKGKNNDQKIKEAVDAMASGRRVVLTDDYASFDASGTVSAFARKNYIAVFEIEDVQYSADDGLRFRLSKRLCNLE
ncbi:hypothetical protein [Mesorhizobium sp. M0118]|uniref:hypothetical protein n=1 Tax=Mesorhizobium sp. M0118 TaxID=2956884 RepID=UPI0033352D06